MITNALLFIIYAIVFGLANVTILLLPDVSLSSGISTAISTATQYIAAIYNIMPIVITAIFICFAVILVLEIFLGGYKLLMWVIRRLPGQS